MFGSSSHVRTFCSNELPSLTNYADSFFFFWNFEQRQCLLLHGCSLLILLPFLVHLHLVLFYICPEV